MMPVRANRRESVLVQDALSRVVNALAIFRCQIEGPLSEGEADVGTKANATKAEVRKEPRQRQHVMMLAGHRGSHFDPVGVRVPLQEAANTRRRNLE
jgi:hypothetical protein